MKSLHPAPLIWALCLVVAATTGCEREASHGSIASTPPAPVTVSQPVTQEVVDYDEYEGRIQAVHTVDLKAQVKGYLTRVEFKDGDVVKAGDLLIVIDDRPYKATLDQAKAAVASAEANLKLAKSEYARYTALAAKGVATREEADTYTSKQGTAAADKLKAEAQVEQAQLDLAFCRIVAPIAGRLGRRMIDIGNLVGTSTNDTLATIVSIDPMYVYFDVDERSLIRYRKVPLAEQAQKEQGHVPSIKEAKIPVEVALEGDQGYPHKGMIDFADNRVNRSTGTIQLRGVLDNTSRVFIDGFRARVRVPTSDPHKVIMVTERAIAAEQGRRFVYVVDDKGVVDRKDVTLGRVHGHMQVVEGLAGNEWVIVNGIQRARAGAAVAPKKVPMPDAEAPQSGTH